MASIQQVPWDKLRRLYVTGRVRSLRDLADKHGIPHAHVKQASRKQKWSLERKDYLARAANTAIEKDNRALADGMAHVQTVLLENVEILQLELRRLMEDIAVARSINVLTLVQRSRLIREAAHALQDIVRSQRLLDGKLDEEPVDRWRAVLVECGLRLDDGGNGKAHPLEPQVHN